jgi:hypothetical protein
MDVDTDGDGDCDGVTLDEAEFEELTLGVATRLALSLGETDGVASMLLDPVVEGVWLAE